MAGDVVIAQGEPSFSEELFEAERFAAEAPDADDLQNVGDDGSESDDDVVVEYLGDSNGHEGNADPPDLGHAMLDAARECYLEAQASQAAVQNQDVGAEGSAPQEWLPSREDVRDNMHGRARLPSEANHTWGQFRFTLKTEIRSNAVRAYSWEVFCPHHAKTSQTSCKKSRIVKTRTLDPEEWQRASEEVLSLLRGWAVQALQYQRQRDHVAQTLTADHKVAKENIERLPDYDGAPPLTDIELDAQAAAAAAAAAAKAKGRGRGRGKAKPKAKAAVAAKAQTRPKSSSSSSSSRSGSSSSSSSSSS